MTTIDESWESGVPKDGKYFPLRPNSKKPIPGTVAHLDAKPYDDFVPLGNYGISLDDKFLLLDFDQEHPLRDDWEAQLDPTWTQKTPGGVHRLFRVPPGFEGKNVSVNRDGVHVADIKVNGYLVGPGSYVDADRGRPAGRYVLIDARDPIPAPEWLLSLCQEKAPTITVNGSPLEEDRDYIRVGENDVSLYNIAKNLRREGYSQEFIEKALAGIFNAGLVEQVPGYEYDARDIKRLARSAMRVEPDLGIGPILPGGWGTLDDLPRIGERDLQWIVDDYIPQDALVMMYGKGGVGKSSLAAWIAAKVTRRDKNFAFVGAGEETPEIFAAKVVACGGNAEYLRFYRGAHLLFPRDIQTFKEALELGEIVACYFDAYRAHMQRSDKANEADRTRDALQPLAQVAADAHCTILCTTHTTKYSEEILGSVEVENVARATLHVHQPKGAPEGLVAATVKKSNFLKPLGSIIFRLDSTTLCDPLTGEVQMQRRESGERVPVTIGYVGEAHVGAVLLSDFDESEDAEPDEVLDEPEQVSALDQLLAS